MSANLRPLHRLAITVAPAGATPIGAVDPPPVAEPASVVEPAPVVVPPAVRRRRQGRRPRSCAPRPEAIDATSMKCRTVAPARGGRF